MTLQQLEYLVAIDAFGHFTKAAAHCFVTQPTLSMQLQKLEEELGIVLFDRSRTPVVPTEAGKEVLEQARKVLQEVARINQLVEIQRGELAGELRIGIIPTLAPYLAPLFLDQFLKLYPKVKFKITELTTNQIVERLKKDQIDAGLLATPLRELGLVEQPLFYEELVAYISKENAIPDKYYILTDDIDVRELWLLEEGHCMRTQVLNLCHLKKKSDSGQFEYIAGSVETLRKMVEWSHGITILPELALRDFTEDQMAQVRHFHPPAPVREISIVTHRPMVKQRLKDALCEVILQHIPPAMRYPANKLVMDIEEDD